MSSHQARLKLTKLRLSQSILALSRQLLVHYHTLARPSSAGTAQNEGYKRAIYSPTWKETGHDIAGALAQGSADLSCHGRRNTWSWVQLQLGAAGCSFQLRLSWLQHCSIAAGRGEAPTEPLWRIQLIRPSDRSLHELHWPSHHPIGLRTTA